MENRINMDENMEFIPAMEQVKPLPLLPNLNGVTVSMAADYYEVSYAVMYACINRSFGKEMLKQYGYRRMTPQDFENAGYKFINEGSSIVKIPNSDQTMNISRKETLLMSQESVFCMAFNLKNSPVAQKIVEAVEKMKPKYDQGEPEESLDDLLEDVAPSETDSEMEGASESPVAGNGMRIFENTEFGRVRTLTIDGEPYFVGKDVAEILGYSNTNKAVQVHVDEEDKKILDFKGFSHFGNTLWGENDYSDKTLINESGLYSLILSSKLPVAKKFKHWVTSEVLPAIRKHGMYAVDDLINNPELAIKAFTALRDEREKNRQLTEQNRNLDLTNKALSVNVQKWDGRAVVNKLIRTYGFTKHGKAEFGWSEFYDNLLYKCGINLNARKSENSKAKRLDKIRDDEWKTAVRLAVAMCENYGINTGEILAKYNLKV